MRKGDESPLAPDPSAWGTFALKKQPKGPTRKYLTWHVGHRRTLSVAETPG